MTQDTKKAITPHIQIGSRIGKLTVVAPTSQRKNGYIVWRCRCNCGVEICLDTTCLQRGTVRDCGCETVVQPGQRDITGQRFGKLVALSPTDKRMDSGSVVWQCHCDCGKYAEVSVRRLIKGQVRSCGCLSNPPRKDYISQRFGRLTVLEYAGTARELGKTGTANFWRCRCDCGSESIVCQTELQNGGTQSCGCLQKEYAAQRLELLDGTSAVLLKQNKKIRSNNRSGHTGVFQEKSGRWIAYISFKKKRYWLGRFSKFQDAVKARQLGEEMHNNFLEWYYAEHSKIKQETHDAENRKQQK